MVDRAGGADSLTHRDVATGDSSSCGGARAARAFAMRSVTTCVSSIPKARTLSCAFLTRARPSPSSSSLRRLSLQVRLGKAMGGIWEGIF
jgi:hypothetical protein